MAEHYDSATHAEKWPTPPSLLNGLPADIQKIRRKFCKHVVPEGEPSYYTDTYEKAINSAKSECERTIGAILEKRFGFHALHPGTFPQDWKMPGGIKEHDYPPTDKDNMMTSKEVIETRAIKRLKLSQESGLYNYVAQYTNICRSHKCQCQYCLRDVNHLKEYSESKHGPVDPSKIIEKDGTQLISVCEQHCRFHYGRKRKYDPSGENDLTRGKPRTVKPTITVDKNGMLSIEMRRNHPRTTQEPHVSYIWGANSNTVILLLPPPRQGSPAQSLARLLPPACQQSCLCRLCWVGSRHGQ